MTNYEAEYVKYFILKTKSNTLLFKPIKYNLALCHRVDCGIVTGKDGQRAYDSAVSIRYPTPTLIRF